ncbi:MAG: EscU/YscU/HrcU family type III secretion system export apparatus switch protein [Alphaproteobacteria bacterium]
MTESRDARGHTPVAVALHYDDETDEAPRVTATGRGAVAEQIVASAFANGVKVRDDADLAQVLESLELDSPVPPVIFATVAEILTRVYRANGRGAEFPDWQADGGAA